MSSTALQWFKSSYSGDEGGACLEVAYTWPKSTYSAGEGPTAIHIRDSKTPDAPHLTVTPAAWTAFLPVLGEVPVGDALGVSGRALHQLDQTGLGQTPHGGVQEPLPTSTRPSTGRWTSSSEAAGSPGKRLHAVSPG